MAATTDCFDAYWELDDATDSHSGGHDFTEVGSPSYVTGKVGNAVQTDSDSGSETYLNIAVADADFAQMGTGSKSVMCWFKVNTLPSTNTAAIIHFGATSASDPGYHITVSSTGQLLVRLCDGTTLDSLILSAGITTGTWYHLCVVMDRLNRIRVWLDNVQIGVQALGVSTSADIQATHDFQVGGRYNANDGAIDIDELVLYSGCMPGWMRGKHFEELWTYADFVAHTGPFVSQEHITEQESNTNNATVAVSDLVADQVALVMLSTDGNATGASLTAWDSAWTNIIDAVAPNPGTTFTRFRVWHHTVSSTDVSTETQVAATWTNNEKATLVVQLWDNCAGVNAFNESSQATSGTSWTEDGVTTDVDGCEILVGISIDGGPTVTAYDAGLTFNDYQVTNASGHQGLWWGSESQATAGATGTYAFTISGTTHCVPFSVAMEPAAGGAGSVSGSVTQGGQTFSGTAEVLVQASGTLTQGGQTLAGTAEVLVQASGSLTQGASTLSSTAEVLVQVNGSLTQGGQVLSGTIGTPQIDVSGALTQGAATLSGSAEVLVQASGALTQGGQTIAGTVAVVVNLSGSLTQGGQTLSGTLADPNNSVRDIELSAAPLNGFTLSAAPLVQITITATPYVQ